MFGIGKSTATKITADFVNLILLQCDMALIKGAFKSFSNYSLTQVLVAIDETHIEILKADNESSVDYLSRKQKYTVNTQAVVCSNLIVLDVATEFPGSFHDTRMFRATKLYQDAEVNIILNKPSGAIENKEVRPIFISDGAYPSTSWQLKPYPFTIRLNDAHKKSHKKWTSVRVTVGRAVDLLERWWRCLLKSLDNRLSNVSFAIIASCLLHNICQIKNEKYIDEGDLVDNIIEQEWNVKQTRAQCIQTCEDGNILRDILTNFISEE